MKLGLDVLLEKRIKEYKGQRIGLVTNMTGVNHSLMPTIDLFYHSPDIVLSALYGPEHGIRGDAKEGEKFDSYTDSYTNVPVYSLYGETKKPTRDMLEDVDIVFFDLQDIGSRYYTFIYTMANVMEACGEHGKKFVVLDRPNPIGGAVEGNILSDDVRSFVGKYPIPNRHGLTVGEMAVVYKHEFGIECDLTVIPMEGWRREMFFDETDLIWVPPSPNTTGIDMCILYPGTCLVEGTNLSEGRGTTRPFEFIGAPYIDGLQLAKRFNELSVEGIIARPISFIPAYQKHADARCEGIQLHVTKREDVQSVKAGLKLLEMIAEMYPNQFAFREPNEKGTSFFDLLGGDRTLKERVLQGKVDEFLADCKPELKRFSDKVGPYLIYD